MKDTRSGKLAVKTILILILLGFFITLSSSILAFIEFRNDIETLFGQEIYQISELVQENLDTTTIESYFTQVKAAKSEEEIFATGDEFIEQPAYQTLQKLLLQIYNSFELDQIYIADLGREMGENLFVSFYYAGVITLDDSPFEIEPGSYSDFEDPKKEIQDIYSNGTRLDHTLHGEREGGVLTLSAILPVFNQDQVIGFISVEKSTTLINEAALGYLLRASLTSLMITTIFIIVFVQINQKTVIEPISKITDSANTFVENRAEPSNELESIKTHDEIEILAQSVLSMERDIVDYVQDLTRITAENERVETELAIASNIQKNLLPLNFPESDSFRLYASMTPAKEVGGDFYDFFMIDPDHLAFVIADVSGKGVPAALFMVTAKTLIKSHTQFLKDQGVVFKDVNNILCENNEEGLFVTCWMGILELSSGKLQYVNAGHNPPALLQNDGSISFLKGKRGLILGTMEDMMYRVNEITLQPGERLFLYTDGVTEAHNSENELYGEKRLLDLLNSTRDQSVQEVLNTVACSVQSFAGESEQFDDITMLMIERMGQND